MRHTRVFLFSAFFQDYSRHRARKQIMRPLVEMDEIDAARRNDPRRVQKQARPLPG